jgi:DNA polymerase
VNDRDQLLKLTRQLKEHAQWLERSGRMGMPRAKSNAGTNANRGAGSEAEPRREAGVAAKALQVVRLELGECTRCKLSSQRQHIVYGVGSPDAPLVFVGEAPGSDEDRTGEPFVGAAGQLLTKMIIAMGLSREQVYICNILKCRPPGNRTPLPNEAANCRSFLERQIDLVKPKFICALGGCAAQNLLNSTFPIGKLRGRFHDFRGIPVLVTYHPAYLLPHRSPDKKRDVWEDMKMLLARMGKPIPQAKKEGP